MRRWILTAQILLAGGLIAAWTPATGGPQSQAVFHFISIVEVFPGTNAKPNAQYVRLQAYSDGQDLVGGHYLFFFNAAGAKVDSALLPSNVANSANQMSILISTPQAETLFAIANDFDMPAAINPAGGKICFDVTNVDCFAWGNYSGSMTGVGAAYRKDFGLALGESARRRLDVFGGATTLESADDTQQSENDFDGGLPNAVNNAGSTLVLPPSTCGNNALEGLEQCDDGNTNPNDGCNSVCDVEYCGDGVVQTSEDCDDSNLQSGDGCSPTCQTEGACPVAKTGDVNLSGTLTSADIIALVGYVFKGGAAPQPCPAAGDVNCSGTVTSSDIIFLVNHVFKGQAAPCDVCTIIPSMWSCP